MKLHQDLCVTCDMNLNPRVRCAFGNVVIHLDLLLLLRTYAHKQLSRNWLKLAENKNKPTLKIIIIKLIKIHSTHRVHCGYLDLLNYNRCCWFVKEKIQGVSSTGPPLKINKRQSTCKSHQKSSQCQIFQWVWHLVIFRAEQLKKPPCICSCNCICIFIFYKKSPLLQWISNKYAHLCGDAWMGLM